MSSLFFPFLLSSILLFLLQTPSRLDASRIPESRRAPHRLLPRDRVRYGGAKICSEQTPSQSRVLAPAHPVVHYSAFPLRSFLFFPFLPSSSSPLPLLPSSLFPSLLCPVCVFPGSLLLSLFLFSLSISFVFDFALISPFYQRLFARLPPPPPSPS